tara:strand:- start:251 stop:763 length:513 start_codon:yes stop_codon:yes gene_type:complete
MISKTDLKNLYEWAKDKDFPLRKTITTRKPYGTNKIESYCNKEIYSYPLKFGRRKVTIRESVMPQEIIDIFKDEDILYTVVSIFQSGTILKPHRDPHIYNFPYKRIQIPLDIPEVGKCTMRWIKGGTIVWEEGVPQVCNVMYDVHEASNLSDKDMFMMFLDVKMDTEVEL